MKPPGRRSVNGKCDKVAHVQPQAEVSICRAAPMGNEFSLPILMITRPLVRLVLVAAAAFALAGCANFPANTPTAAASQPPAQTKAP